VEGAKRQALGPTLVSHHAKRAFHVNTKLPQIKMYSQGRYTRETSGLVVQCWWLFIHDRVGSPVSSHKGKLYLSRADQGTQSLQRRGIAKARFRVYERSSGKPAIGINHKNTSSPQCTQQCSRLIQGALEGLDVISL
jgi:hypothetical protein